MQPTRVTRRFSPCPLRGLHDALRSLVLVATCLAAAACAPSAEREPTVTDGAELITAQLIARTWLVETDDLPSLHGRQALPTSMAVTTTGDVIVAGRMGPTIFLSSLGSGGEERWTRVVDSNSTVVSVVAGAAGSFYVAGVREHDQIDFGVGPLQPLAPCVNDGGEWKPPGCVPLRRSDVYVAKLDRNGNVLWNKIVRGAAGDTKLLGAAVTRADELVLYGDAAGVLAIDHASFGVPAEEHAFVAKLSPGGDLLAGRTFADARHGDGVAVGPTGEIALSGTRLFSSTYTAWLKVLDPTGALRWERRHFFPSAADRWQPLPESSARRPWIDGEGNVVLIGGARKAPPDLGGPLGWPAPGASASDFHSDHVFLASYEPGGTYRSGSVYAGVAGSALGGDALGRAYLTAELVKSGPPTVAGRYSDHFLARVDAAGSMDKLYALGRGVHVLSMAFAADGSAVIAGYYGGRDSGPPFGVSVPGLAPRESLAGFVLRFAP